MGAQTRGACPSPGPRRTRACTGRTANLSLPSGPACTHLNLDPCRLNTRLEVDGRSNNATRWANHSTPQAGDNSRSKGGVNLSSKGGSNRNRCTTCHRRFHLGFDAQAVASALTISGVSVRYAVRETQPCRIDQSTTNPPCSSRGSSSNQTVGARITPERVKPTRLVPPPAVLSPNMK